MCVWNECLDLEVTVFIAPSAEVVVDGHMLQPPAAHCLLPERPCLLTYCISVWYAGCSSADIWWTPSRWKPSASSRCCSWSPLKMSQKQQRWRHGNLKVFNPLYAARVCTVVPPKVQQELFGFNVVKSHQCQRQKAKYDKWSWGSSPHPTPSQHCILLATVHDGFQRRCLTETLTSSLTATASVAWT